MKAASLGAALDDLQRRFGGRFTVKETVADVDINAPEIVGGNPERICLVICNLGTADTYLSVGQTGAFAGRGIRLPGGGGTFAINLNDDGLLVTLPWHGFNAAGENVFVQQVWRDTLTPVDDVTP